MRRQKAKALEKPSTAMLIIGALLIAISIFYNASILAILGTAFLFWGVILFYLTTSKHIPLTYLDFLTIGSPDTVERILSEFNLTEKGIYLPPKNLKRMESSLVFLPKKANTLLPMLGEVTDNLFCKEKAGILLTPPGLGLSLLFEKELNISFTKTDFKYLQLNLPKLLIEDLEILESIELNLKGNTVTIEVVDSIFNGICEQTNNQPRTHAQVGCLFASALACVLAKTIGKPIVIERETQNLETRTTLIQYRILENEPPPTETTIKLEIR